MTAEEKARRKKIYEKHKPAYDALMAVYPFTLEDLDGEIWAWIRGYEGDYQESTFGRTKSFKYNTPRILKPLFYWDGYLRLELSKGNKIKNYRVNRLVAETFIPNPYGKAEVDHRDGCKLNNFVENLRWATGDENIQYAIELGLKPVGSECPYAAFNDEQILEIRRIYIKGDLEFGSAALAKKFGVARSTIQRIVTGKTYGHID